MLLCQKTNIFSFLTWGDTGSRFSGFFSQNNLMYNKYVTKADCSELLRSAFTDYRGFQDILLHLKHNRFYWFVKYSMFSKLLIWRLLWSYSSRFPKYCIFMGELSHQLRKVNQKIMRGGQVGWDTMHLWKGTWLIEHQYVYFYKICISKCWKHLIHKNPCFTVCLNYYGN